MIIYGGDRHDIDPILTLFNSRFQKKVKFFKCCKENKRARVPRLGKTPGIYLPHIRKSLHREGDLRRKEGTRAMTLWEVALTGKEHKLQRQKVPNFKVLS